MLPEEDDEPDNMIEAQNAKGKISQRINEENKIQRIMKRRGEKDYIYNRVMKKKETSRRFTRQG